LPNAHPPTIPAKPPPQSARDPQPDAARFGASAERADNETERYGG
jgi:hypothetical protein